MDWPNFLRGILYSFLPKHLWGSWRPSSTVDFTYSALVSGLLESGIGALLLIQGYVHFLPIRIRQMQPAAQANQGTQLYFPVMLSIEYMFHPFSLIASYLVGEGILRSSAAFFTDEVIPSFPIKILVRMQNRRKEQRQKASLGPPLSDLLGRVQGQEYELRISSQSPKDGWRVSVTISIDGEFHEVVRADAHAGNRPFVYLLRRLPSGSAIRGVYRYDPPSQLETEGVNRAGV